MANEIDGHTALGEARTEGILTREHLGSDPHDVETGPMPATYFGDPEEAGVIELN
jgi:hypothetical protein